MANTLDDLEGLHEPKPPGVQDAFQDASLRALEHSQAAYRSAPRQTQSAHNMSLEAAQAADLFGEALGPALEATGKVYEFAPLVEEALEPWRSSWKEGIFREATRAARLRRAALKISNLTILSMQSLEGEELAELDAERAEKLAENLEFAEHIEKVLRDPLGLEYRWRKPESAQAAAQELVEIVALLVEAQALKADRVGEAEDRRNHAIRAYRLAAAGWRELGTRAKLGDLP